MRAGGTVSRRNRSRIDPSDRLGTRLDGGGLVQRLRRPANQIGGGYVNTLVPRRESIRSRRSDARACDPRPGPGICRVPEPMLPRAHVETVAATSGRAGGAGRAARPLPGLCPGHYPLDPGRRRPPCTLRRRPPRGVRLLARTPAADAGRLAVFAPARGGTRAHHQRAGQPPCRRSIHRRADPPFWRGRSLRLQQPRRCRRSARAARRSGGRPACRHHAGRPARPAPSPAWPPCPGFRCCRAVPRPAGGECCEAGTG